MQEIWQQFITRQQKVEDREYLFSTILVAAAPTIAKLKPATLIQLSDSSKRNLKTSWEKYCDRYQAIIPRIRLNYCELLHSKKYILLLVYEESILEKQLHLADIQTFLHQAGAEVQSVTGGIHWIKLQMMNRFPHEIGVLLGYPTTDILAFIENKGQDYLLNGYWKVYSHPLDAKRTFALYDHAKKVVIEYFTEKWDKLNMEVE